LIHRNDQIKVGGLVNETKLRDRSEDHELN